MQLNDDEYVLGIDLGTTNTCASYYMNGFDLPEVVVYQDGTSKFESCVEYSAGGIIAGHGAKVHLRNGRSNIVRNAKRIIGHYYADKAVKESIEKKQCGVEIVEVGGKPMFLINGSYISPSDSSAEILKSVMQRTQELAVTRGRRPMKLKKVTVTIPANFNNNQRTATLLACEKAGVKREILKLLNEPSAAAFFYCTRNRIDNETILVYDLGGGTFDVSIIKVENGDYTVLKYAGDFFLGGADFDAALAKFIVEKAKENNGPDVFDKLQERRKRLFDIRINEIAEEVKEKLSINEHVDASLSAFIVNNDDDNCAVEVKRSDLNQCIADDINRSINLVLNCIAECDMTVDDIDRVVLIGGSSRLPLVRSKLEEIFHGKLGQEVNPDEAVACGACYSMVENMNLKDRIVYSLGQLITNHRVQCLIPRQSVIPLCSQPISTHPGANYINTVKCAIYQGRASEVSQNESANDCYLLEEYDITGFDCTIRQNVTFVTTFSVDEWGIIHVVDHYKEKDIDLVNMMFRWKDPQV